VDLSVVIVNWNTRDFLSACLAHLRTALGASSLRAEIIVVDNASADGSAAMVAEEFPEVRLIANRENRNYAAGSNDALRAATGDFVLLLNPDTQVPSGAPEALLRVLEERPAAGAVAPALVYPDGRVQPSVRGFPSPPALLGELTGLARLLPRSRWGAYRPRDLPEADVAPVEQPMASAFLVRRAALNAIGHFDERFPLFFNDVDLCYRLKEAGWEILYDPRVRVVHAGGASTRQVRPAAILQSHEGLRRFYGKHYRGHLFWPAYAAIVIMIHLTGYARAGVASLRGGKSPRPAAEANTGHGNS
jgi:hypothetical protein